MSKYTTVEYACLPITSLLPYLAPVTVDLNLCATIFQEMDRVNLKCPIGSTIKAISSATYGSYQLAPRINCPTIPDINCALDIKNYISRNCLGLNKCRIYLGRQVVFGDAPCGGNQNYYSINYVCSPTSPPRAPINTDPDTVAVWYLENGTYRQCADLSNPNW